VEHSRAAGIDPVGERGLVAVRHEVLDDLLGTAKAEAVDGMRDVGTVARGSQARGLRLPGCAGSGHAISGSRPAIVNDLAVDVYLVPDSAQAGRSRFTDRLWLPLPVVEATRFCRSTGRSKGVVLGRAAGGDRFARQRRKIHRAPAGSGLRGFRGKWTLSIEFVSYSLRPRALRIRGSFVHRFCL
jgi:hypothetical protein